MKELVFLKICGNFLGMTTAPLRPADARSRTQSLIEQLLQCPEILTTYPVQVEELRKFGRGEITTAKAIYIIRNIQNDRE